MFAGKKEGGTIMTAVKIQNPNFTYYNSSLKLEGVGYIYSRQNIILI